MPVVSCKLLNSMEFPVRFLIVEGDFGLCIDWESVMIIGSLSGSGQLLLESPIDRFKDPWLIFVVGA